MQRMLGAWAASPEAALLQSSLDAREGSTTMLADTGISKGAEHEKAGWWTQFNLLSARCARNMWRNQLIIKGKAAQTIFLSLVIGLIYLQIPNDLVGVQDRQGSLFFLVVQALFGSVMGALTTFGTEKVVFQREYRSDMYGLSSYFCSRWVVDLPSHIILPIISSAIVYWMIGYQADASKFWWFTLIMILMDNAGQAIGIFVSCLFNDMNMALTVMPMILLPLMVFSGFFVQSDSIPPYFSWIQWISPMKYGFVALCLNEFTGLNIYCTTAQNCAPGYNGETVLSNLGFLVGKGSIGFNCGLLAVLWMGFTGFAFVALWNATRADRS